MKKELIIHFSFMIAFVAGASVVRNWTTFAYWPVWAGAILGTILPDIDNLIHTLFLSSQGVAGDLRSTPFRQKFTKSLGLMYAPREENSEPIFHSAQFQLVFLVFAFLLVTSSSSLFGIGLVLAFMLHLVIDQAVDYMEKGNINQWFKEFPLDLDSHKKLLYLGANGLMLLVFGFFL